MALKRRKILKQMLDLGHGTSNVPSDSGGTQTGDKIGIHTFLPAYFSAKDFNATGDGSTDDTTAIVTAMTTLGTTGGVLFFPSGTYSTTGFTIPDNVQIAGAGRESTVLSFTPSSGTAMDFSNSNYVAMSDITLRAASAGNSAVGIYLYKSQHGRFCNVYVDGFATNVQLSATNDANSRTFDTRFTDVQSVNFTAAGFQLDHAVDTYMTNVQNYSYSGNPSTGYAVIVDTGTSGLHINGMAAVGAGFIVQNSAGSSETYDQPPEYIHANQVLMDTVTGTPAFKFDSSLGVADGLGRLGKSYRFEQCWAAFTQTNGMPGILMEGGENITFIDPLVRVNKYHGIQITGGDNIHIINPQVLGNNQQNAASINGIHIAANVNNFKIIGGVSGNSIAGETGHQKYGIYVAAGTSNAYTIEGVDCSQGNETNGIFDGGTGAVKSIIGNVGVMDNGSGTTAAAFSRLYGSSGRFEFHNGNCYLDCLVSDANSIIFSADANDYWAYVRNTNRWNHLVGGTIVHSITSGGVGIFGATDASAALTVTSTTKGFLPPVMTSTQRDNISSPATGLQIYNSTTGKINFYDGGAWRVVTST